MAIKFSWEKIIEGRFKMSLDEAWELESGKNKNDEKIWYQRIILRVIRSIFYLERNVVKWRHEVQNPSASWQTTKV